MTNLVNVPLTSVGECVLKHVTGYHPIREWGQGMMSIFQLAQMLVRLQNTSTITLVPSPMPRDVAHAIAIEAKRHRRQISSADLSVITRGVRELRTVNPDHFKLSF